MKNRKYICIFSLLGLLGLLNFAYSGQLVYSTYLGGSSDEQFCQIAIDTAGNVYVTGMTYSSNFPVTSNAFDTSIDLDHYIDIFVSKLDATGSTLLYSTYLGGFDYEYSGNIAVDLLGNAYVTGNTYSSDFPTTPGAFDTTLGSAVPAFVTKLNPSGSALVYSTFLGGNSGFTLGTGIAVDTSGNAYITGYVETADFPVTVNAFDTTFNGNEDVFVTKLNPTGTALLYSTYLGGGGDDDSFDIALDNNGNVYVTGQTNSSNYPITLGAFDTTYHGNDDVFVAKLSTSDSTLFYSTILGGNVNDRGWGIAIDSFGDAYIAGYTSSTNFPVTPGAYDTNNHTLGDIFVTKLNPTGTALVYSTYLGGNGSEGYWLTPYRKAVDIAIDGSGNTYITGYTSSTDFTVTANAFDTSFNGGYYLHDGYDAFVTRLNANGSGLDYSTYLGGSLDDGGSTIALDNAGNIYVAGSTGSSDFPTTTGAYNITNNGSFDIFITKINPNATSVDQFWNVYK
jgi:hypothetical protein